MKAKGERKTKAQLQEEVESLRQQIGRVIALGTAGKGPQPQDLWQFLRTVIDAISEVTMVIDRDYRVVLANRAARELAGGRDPVAEHLTCHLVSHHCDAPCDGREHSCPLEQVSRTKAPVTVEHTHVDAEGGEIFVTITAVPIFDDAGDVVWIVESCRDITERKRAEDLIHTQGQLAKALGATRELNEGLRLCLEASLSASGMDCGGIYLVEEASGALDMVHHQGLSDGFVARASHYDADSINARLVMAGKPVYSQYLQLGVPLDSAEEREGLLAIAVVPICHEDRVIGCLNVASHRPDEVPAFSREVVEAIAAEIGSAITRLKAEDELRSVNECYERVTDNADEVIFRVGPIGAHVTYANPAAERLLGYSQAEWLADPALASRIILPDYVEKQRQIIEEINTNRETIKNAVLGWTAKDGREIIVEYTIIPVMDEEGRLLCFESIGRDITDRKRAEKEIENLAKFPSEDPDPVLRISADGTVLYTNAVGEGLLAAWGSGVGQLVPDVWRDRVSWSLDEGAGWQEALAHEGRVFSFSGVPVPAAGYVNLYGRDVTDRRRAEDGLRHLSSRQQAILASVPDIIVEADDRKVYTWANQAGLEFFGPDVLGREANYYFEGQQNTYDVVQPLFDGSEDTIYIESWQRRRDGAKRLLAWWCQVLKDSRGHVTGTLSTARDITEQRQGEQALRDSEERYRQVVSSTADAVMVFDAETRTFVEVNEACTTLYGYSREEFLQLKQDDITSEPAESDATILQTVVGAQHRIPLRYHKKKDGTIFPVEITGSSFTYRGRQVGCGVVCDITERKRAEEEAKRLQERIDFILGATNTGVDIIDSDFNIRHINPEWQAHYGDPAGRKCHEYFMGRNTVCPGCGIVEALRTKQPTVTQEVLPKEGNRPVQVTTIPFQDENGDWLVAEVNVDISERLRMEEQLRQSQKMEAVGQLAGGISHDFRNQLQVIKGFTSMVLRRGLVADEGREKLEMVLAAVGRSTHLSNQLLAFSRQETLHRETVNPHDLVRDIQKSLPHMLGEDIRLLVSLGRETVYVELDAAQFHQAMINLCLNARDAMPKGGELLIELDSTDLDKAFVRPFDGAAPGKYVVVSVQDSGIGMDEQTRA